MNNQAHTELDSNEGDTGAACVDETVEEQRGTDAVVYMAESGGVRVGEGAHVSVRRDGERTRGRPRAEGEDDACALGKCRRYSTMRWGAVAREAYQQAQQACCTSIWDKA